MLVFWGPQRICFYNDAASALLGPEQHPSALGGTGPAVCTETWGTIGPQVDRVLAGQGATWQEHQPVPAACNGRRETMYWTYGCSPIDDDAAQHGAGGVHIAVMLASGYTDAAAEWSERPAVELLGKPYRLDELETALSPALSAKAGAELPARRCEAGEPPAAQS